MPVLKYVSRWEGPERELNLEPSFFDVNNCTYSSSLEERETSAVQGSAGTYHQPPVLLELHSVVVHSDPELAQSVLPVLLFAVLVVVIFVAISVFFTAVAAVVVLCNDALHINILEVLRQVFGPHQHVGVLTSEVILQMIKGGVLGVPLHGAIPETCGCVGGSS